MRYSVHCPSAPYENSSFVDIDDAWGLCLDLSEEFGYAEVRLGEHVLGVTPTVGDRQSTNCHTLPPKRFNPSYSDEVTNKATPHA